MPQFVHSLSLSLSLSLGCLYFAAAAVVRRLSGALCRSSVPQLRCPSPPLPFATPPSVAWSWIGHHPSPASAVRVGLWRPGPWYATPCNSAVRRRLSLPGPQLRRPCLLYAAFGAMSARKPVLRKRKVDPPPLHPSEPRKRRPPQALGSHEGTGVDSPASTTSDSQASYSSALEGETLLYMELRLEYNNTPFILASQNGVLEQVV